MMPASIPTTAQQVRFLSRVDWSGGWDSCWTWLGRKQGGYGVFDYGGGSQLAHRVMFGLMYGEMPTPDRCVMHTCDNPGCVNPEHLKLGTWGENNRDRAVKGRSAKRVVRAGFLTADGVLEAQRLRKKGQTLKQVAEFLGVDLTTVSKVTTGVNGRSLYVG